MADARAKELIDLGNRLFAKKDPMNTLWQFACANSPISSSSSAKSMEASVKNVIG